MSAVAVAVAEIAPVRPALVPLSEVLERGPAGQVPAPGFSGLLDGELREVTAVLERTAVVEVAPGDRRVVRKTALLVDPATISWQPAPERPGLVHRGRRRAARPSPSGSGPARGGRAGAAVQTPPARPDRVGALETSWIRPVDKPAARPPELQLEEREELVAGELVDRPAAAEPQPATVRASTTTPAAPVLSAWEPDEDALRTASGLGRLPLHVRQLVEQLVTALVRIQELEEELERHRETERRILRSVDRRLRSSGRAPAEQAGRESPHA